MPKFEAHRQGFRKFSATRRVIVRNYCTNRIRRAGLILIVVTIVVWNLSLAIRRFTSSGSDASSADVLRSRGSADEVRLRQQHGRGLRKGAPFEFHVHEDANHTENLIKKTRRSEQVGNKSAGLILEFFRKMDERNKPNLHNIRHILTDVLGYEVIKCPNDAGSVDDCPLPSSATVRDPEDACWSMLWIYGGVPEARRKVLSSLEVCPGAAVGFYPGIDDVFVGREAFTRVRNVAGVAKSFLYPDELDEAAGFFETANFSLAKSSQHRGRGIQLIAKPEPPKIVPPLNSTASYNHTPDSNGTSINITETRPSPKPFVIPSWKDVWKAELSADAAVLQEFVSDPLLLHGRFFDVGVFVALVSVNPMRVYVYDDDFAVKVNRETYYADAGSGNEATRSFDPAEKKRFVISDANNMFLAEVPEIDNKEAIAAETVSKQNAAAGKQTQEEEKSASRINETMSEKDILRHYFTTKFDNKTAVFDNAWKEAKTILVDVFAAREEAISERLASEWGTYDDESTSRGTKLGRTGGGANKTAQLPPEAVVFQLFRADFVFDSKGKPHLTEINGMPQFVKDHRMSVLLETFQLVGLDSNVCGGGDTWLRELQYLCPEDCRSNLGWCSREKCRETCFKCLTQRRKIQASRVHCEMKAARHFQRILPPSRDRAAVMRYVSAQKKTAGFENVWMFDWIDAHYPNGKVPKIEIVPEQPIANKTASKVR